jgi:hypothetical protein
MKEESLRQLVATQRKWYENLNSKLKKDCQIKRAVQSGEMHNWMVCMRVFRMSSKELSEYYKQIKNDPLINKTNELIYNFTTNSKKLHQIIMQRQIEEGHKFSDVQLAIAGLK